MPPLLFILACSPATHSVAGGGELVLTISGNSEFGGTFVLPGLADIGQDARKNRGISDLGDLGAVYERFERGPTDYSDQMVLLGHQAGATVDGHDQPVDLEFDLTASDNNNWIQTYIRLTLREPETAIGVLIDATVPSIPESFGVEGSYSMNIRDQPEVILICDLPESCPTELQLDFEWAFDAETLISELDRQWWF